MSDVTLYHNPNCGTSRNVLAMLRERGIEPAIIEYLKTPPTRETLKALIAATGLPMREAMRGKDALFSDLGLGDPKWTDDELLDFMGQHPILMNRPIVVTPKGTKLCRPKELVLDLL
jgi:arsenate reductase